MKQIQNRINPFSIGRSDELVDTLINLMRCNQRLDETRRSLYRHAQQPSITSVLPDYLEWTDLPLSPEVIKLPVAKR